MVRTQIQLPDDVFAKAKKLCEASEISFTDPMLSVSSLELWKAHRWQLPKPRNLGWKGLSHAEIKEQAQFAATE
jgi:hypothetical protein